MPRTLLAVLLFLIPVIPTACAQDNVPPPSKNSPESESASMRVLWTISNLILLPTAEISADQAGQMLFTPLDMTATSITFDHQTCNDVIFERREVDLSSATSFLTAAARKELAVTDDEAVLVETSCHIHGFKTFLRLPDNRLLVKMHGVLFVFQPNINR